MDESQHASHEWSNCLLFAILRYIMRPIYFVTSHASLGIFLTRDPLDMWIRAVPPCDMGPGAYSSPAGCCSLIDAASCQALRALRPLHALCGVKSGLSDVSSWPVQRCEIVWKMQLDVENCRKRKKKRRALAVEPIFRLCARDRSVLEFCVFI